MIKYGKIQKKHKDKLDKNFENFEIKIENRINKMETKVENKLDLRKINAIDNKFNHLENKINKLYDEKMKSDNNK